MQSSHCLERLLFARYDLPDRVLWLTGISIGARSSALTSVGFGRDMLSPRNTAVLTGLWIGRLLFKGAALIVGLLLIVVVWFWDASLLTQAADQNLRLIKQAAGLLPQDWSSRVESALRIFGADRALLLTEAVALAKLVLLGIGFPFRRLPR